jgi:hypothetical protein
MVQFPDGFQAVAVQMVSLMIGSTVFASSSTAQCEVTYGTGWLSSLQQSAGWALRRLNNQLN